MPFLPTLCASLMLAAATVSAGAAPFAAERWNKRIVVVFADKPDGSLAQQMDELLADESALAEREMLVVQVVGSNATARFGTLPANVSADALRRAYDVAKEAPLTVILIGKDGGEKLRRTEPVSASNVFGLIDSMPMRRNEADGG